jgi:AbrB family looped-hinge helix DNA binding protein
MQSGSRVDSGARWCHNGRVSDTNVVSVGPKGRIVIPASIRRELSIGEGSSLVAMVEGGGVLLLPRSEVKRRLRGLFARVPVSLSRELIDDRKREAEIEDRA